MLIAQYQYAVTRKDMVETFSFEDFKEVQIDTSSSCSFVRLGYEVILTTSCLRTCLFPILLHNLSHIVHWNITNNLDTLFS